MSGPCALLLRVVSLTVWALALIALVHMPLHVHSQNCNVTSAEWARIKNYTSVRNFVAGFIANGDCNRLNPTGLLAKYSNCSSNLQTIVAEQGLEPGSSCIDAISASLGKTGNTYEAGELSSIATRICTARSFGDTMSDSQAVQGYFCVPVEVYGCPEGPDGMCDHPFLTAVCSN